MLKTNTGSSEELIRLRKDKEKLETAIAKCDIIGREMEEYYMGEISKLKQELQEYKISNNKLDKRNAFLEKQID